MFWFEAYPSHTKSILIWLIDRLGFNAASPVVDTLAMHLYYYYIDKTML